MQVEVHDDAVILRRRRLSGVVLELPQTLQSSQATSPRASLRTSSGSRALLDLATPAGAHHARTYRAELAKKHLPPGRLCRRVRLASSRSRALRATIRAIPVPRSKRPCLLWRARPRERLLTVVAAAHRLPSPLPSSPRPSRLFPPPSAPPRRPRTAPTAPGRPPHPRRAPSSPLTRSPFPLRRGISSPAGVWRSTPI